MAMTGTLADFAAQAPGATGYRVDHPAAAHVGIIDADAGILDWRGRKKVALCGFAESSRHRIPVDDSDWILAGLNQLYRHLPRWDVWFDVHENWRDGNLEGTDHEGWLAACGIPVLMAQREPSVPTSVRYPADRIARRAGGIDYLTSTASHMLAWALDAIDADVEAEGRNRVARAGGSVIEAAAAVRGLYAQYTVGIFGIDLLAETEFARQRPCAEFWIGRLAARGVGILIPPESALLKQPHRYGATAAGLAALTRHAAARTEALDAALTGALARVERLAGRREEQMRWQQAVEILQRGGTIPDSFGKDVS